MSFKKKIYGTWYNGNGERIRNPKAYAYSIYGRPYKNNYSSKKTYTSSYGRSYKKSYSSSYNNSYKRRF